MTDHLIHPSPPPRGELTVPGDKSISQRVAMLAGMSEGVSEVRGFLRGEDALNTLQAICALGASAHWENDLLRISGTPRFSQPADPLDLGNSGTGIRLLSGLLAGLPLDVTLTGDASLCSRPMRRISDPLNAMGAQVDLLGQGTTPPIRVRGGHLSSFDYPLPMASAQVKSCILLAGLHASGDIVVHEPAPTRDHTEHLFAALGVPLEIDGLTIRMRGGGPDGPGFKARNYQVPSDFSSAAFWIMAAATCPGSEICIRQVGLNPRRTAFLNVMQRMGARLTIATAADSLAGDPHGDIFVRGAELSGTEVFPEEISNLIDELPLVAVAGALAEGVTVIAHAEELRVKESDRIATMVQNLRHLGVRVEEKPDGMIVYGPGDIRQAGPVQSFHDHRIAMSAALLATRAAEPVKIENTACIQTSYPQFWTHARQLGIHIS